MIKQDFKFYSFNSFQTLKMISIPFWFEILTNPFGFFCSFVFNLSLSKQFLTLRFMWFNTPFYQWSQSSIYSFPHFMPCSICFLHLLLYSQMVILLLFACTRFLQHKTSTQVIVSVGDYLFVELVIPSGAVRVLI